MKKMLFVFNPRSGKGLIRTALLDIVDVFTRGGFEVVCYPTQKPRDGYRKILEDGSNFDVVVVSGGDGTMSEAVTALMQLPKMIPVGYIPTGSTNDFAASMRISTNMIDAAQDIVDGVYFEYDVGQFNRQRYFVYVAAFGIFTDVPYETPQDAKNIFGHAAYIAEGIKRFTSGSYKVMDITVEHDGIRESGNFLLGIVSNSTSIGGMKVPMRDGVYFDDGLFEVTLVRTRDAHSGVSGNWLPDYWFDKNAAAGGSMMDLGCHPMYLLAYFLGKPKRVTGLFTAPYGKPVDENAVAIAEFAGGALGVAETGFISAGSPQTVEIYGTEGSMIAHGEDVTFQSSKYAAIHRGPFKPTLPDPKPAPLYQFLDAVANGTGSPEGLGIDDAIALTELLENAYKGDAANAIEVL